MKSQEQLQCILAALRSGWMRQSDIARRVGLTRARIGSIAKQAGIDAREAYEIRQDKIWEEIKRRIIRNP